MLAELVQFGLVLRKVFQQMTQMFGELAEVAEQQAVLFVPDQFVNAAC